MPFASIKRCSAQVTGALVREICPQVRTKGKLTACGNDHELRYKGKRQREEWRGRKEKKRGKQMPLFLAFSVRAIYLLSTCLLKRGGGKAGREEVRGGRRPPGSGIRSSVTNDSSEKFALLLAPLPFQVFQSAKNSQTDIYLEGFTLRYTRTVSFSLSPLSAALSSGATIDAGSAFQSSRGIRLPTPAVLSNLSLN